MFIYIASTNAKSPRQKSERRALLHNGSNAQGQSHFWQSRGKESEAKQRKARAGASHHWFGGCHRRSHLPSRPGACNIMEELCWGIRAGDGAYPPLLSSPLLDHLHFFWLKQLACRPALHLPFLGASPFPHLLLRSSRPVTVTRIRSSLSNSILLPACWLQATCEPPFFFSQSQAIACLPVHPPSFGTEIQAQLNSNPADDTSRLRVSFLVAKFRLERCKAHLHTLGFRPLLVRSKVTLRKSQAFTFECYYVNVN